MAHKALVSGTAYTISSGKSMVSGTSYSIKGGKTLVGGTGYNISFSSGEEPTAMFYSDGNFVFQYGSEVASGKTLTASYTGFEDVEYSSRTEVPWNSANMANIKSVSFNNEIKPISLAYWFSNAVYMTSFNAVNLNMTNVRSMAYAYHGCWSLTSSPICGSNVTNMFNAYYGCTNLTGNPVCGNNVTNMAQAYCNCNGITGNPVCGNNVTNMFATYNNCRKLTGSPVCGNNVTSMAQAYWNCTNLTGNPVCGNNVTSMARAYQNCTNLKGSPVCGNNVTNMAYAYYHCPNLSAGTFYFYAKNIANARNCFGSKNNSRRYNIHVPANSTTFNTFIKNTASTSLVGKTITWTNNSTCWYNTTYNIYIYANTSMA